LQGRKYLDVYVHLIGNLFQLTNTAEKNCRRGKTNSVQSSIDEHLEWQQKQLQEIESQIQKAIALDKNWRQKKTVASFEIGT
jgi:apolipoprotein N-acyltransferase